MITKEKFLVIKVRHVREAVNLTAAYEPIV
jgi:hypothetical protein